MSQFSTYLTDTQTFNVANRVERKERRKQVNKNTNN